MTGTNPTSDDILLRLYQTIESRRTADPEVSHTARLFQKGTKKIAQKVGEEAVEVVIEAIRNNRKRLVDESADLMYHLLVLWADAHIDPSEIWAELSQRAGISGVAEKASRGPDKDD